MVNGEKALRHVDWKTFCDNFLGCVGANRPTSEANAKKRKRTADKLSLLGPFQQAHNPSSLTDDANHTSQWRSRLCVLSIHFMHLVKVESL